MKIRICVENNLCADSMVVVKGPISELGSPLYVHRMAPYGAESHLTKHTALTKPHILPQSANKSNMAAQTLRSRKPKVNQSLQYQEGRLVLGISGTFRNAPAQDL